MKAFPTMLKGLAQDHFYNNQLSSRTLEEVCTNLRNFFEGPGYHRRNLDEWNSTTLASTIAKNPEKTTYENVQLLINKLRQLQYGLSPALRNTEFLHNKLVTACQGSPACRYAVSDPPADLGNLINKLQSSITSYEKEQEQEQVSGAFFTDRRYRSNGQSKYKGQSNYKSRPSTRRPYSRDAYYPHDASNRRTCFICKKEGCRSWKHAPQEQEEERARFKSRNLGRFNTNTHNFDGRFKEAYRQYVAEFEGDESSSEDDLGDAFEALLVASDNQEDEQPKDDTSTPTQFFTSLGSHSNQGLLDQPATGHFLAEELANRACVHQLTSIAPTIEFETEEAPECLTPESLTTGSNTSRYGTDHFYGIIIDTGASKYSTAGFAQFQALQSIDNTIKLDSTTKGKVNVQFGIGATSSIGSALVNTPIGQVEFHIMLCKTPFLLSLDDMDALGVYFNNLTNVLVTQQGNVPVVRRFGHSFLLWNSSLQGFIMDSFNYTTCYLTNVELQRIHRRFGHPSIARLQKVLERAGHDIDKQALEYLTKYCVHCQRHGQSPGRFKFNLRDDVQFNYSIIVDIFYIGGKPVLHVVDEGTRYQAGKWLQNITAKHTWDVLRMCWIDTYLGPPEQIVTDAGKNFASKEFDQYTTTLGTRIKIVPVEAHNSIGIVERYHGPIRRAYTIITTEIHDIDKDMALQMAFKAINDSAGPDGLIPTLLVYGAYPRMSEHETPTATIAQRALAIKKAMAEIQKLRAKRQVADALNTRNGPTTTSTLDLPLNSQVLVWREGNTGQTGSWNGPYRLVSTNNESCVVALPHGNIAFRTTVVKPYLTPKTGFDGIEMPEIGDTELAGDSTVAKNPTTQPALPVQLVQPAQPVQPVKRGQGRPRKYPINLNIADISVFLQDEPSLQDEQYQYTESRQVEISGLLEKGVFETISILDVPQGTRIFNARFVDEIKNKGTDKAFEKSRLVVQAYNDDGKQLVLTQSPTIQRVSQRIILCIAAIEINDTHLYLRDISQAYVQSTTLLNRDFYIRPPPELAQRLGINENLVLKVIKPLYGVPEAGNHWFKTYHSHHIKELSMEQSTYDPCLLYSNEPFGIVGLQTDDTLFIGDTTFAEQEQLQLQKAGFLAKERECLTPNKNIKFNGGIIQLQDDGITLTQERQCSNLKLVGKSANTTSSRGVIREGLSIKEQYVAQRARGAYIASVCQPEAAFDLSVTAQASDPDDKSIKTLNKRLQWQVENAARGIRFVKLDKSSLKLLAFTDASFANNRDLSSQIGYILVLADGAGHANILHWSSIKCKRVTRSVLASELYAMVHGFDIGASIKFTIERALKISLPLVLCTDSKSLYDCLVKLGTTQEKRLMIDVMCLRQAYERREIAEVKWIQGDTNPADSMTKEKPSNALEQLIDTNRVHLEVVEWVERSDTN
jgi:hypothetical protein